MTKLDITDVILSFRNAALRALEAGFDMIELHAAHGYLLNQFLSPLTNTRTDEYGGHLENRFRLLREVIESIHDVWPHEYPLFVRISAEEYHPNGNHLEDLAKVVNMLKDLGVDVVDVSSGGVVSYPIDTFPGYQVNFADVIKKETDVPTIAGGLITDANVANDILSNGQADLIYLGTELLRNPYWPLHASVDLDSPFEWPKYGYTRLKK